MNFTQKQNDAVSPVVGVMLMLVVTIIIAALVSSFAGGLVSDQRTAPVSQLSVGYTANIVDTDKNNSVPDITIKPNNGLVFRLMAGDSFSLKDISVQLKARDKVLSLDMSDILNKSAAVEEGNKLSIITNSQGNQTYFGIVGGEANPLISVGDSFILLADSCYDNTQDASIAADKKGRYLTWTPEGDTTTFEIMTNDVLEYKIIDQISGKPIQSGTLIIRG